MKRAVVVRQIVALLKYVKDSDMDNLLWMVQKFAAEGLNKAI